MPAPPSYSLYQPCIAPPSEAVDRMDPDSLDWRNGVVVRAPNWLGDTLMTLPAVYKLTTLMPDDCRLAVACPQAFAPLWTAAAWVDEVIPFTGKRITGRAAEKIRAMGAGAAVVLPNSFGSALDIVRKGIPVRAGRAGRGRRFILTHTVPKWTPAERHSKYHQVSHYLDIVRLFGEFERTCEYPSLTVADAPATAAQKGLNPVDDKWIALAPGAAYGPAKQWPLAAYTETARRWVADGGRVAILGTDRETPLGTHIAARVEGTLNLCGQTSLPELMAMLSCCKFCVANDSGIMHLAAALGTSGAAIFGSTNPDATGPLGAPWMVLQSAADCACCFQRKCSLPNDRQYACLKGVTPEDVMTALDVLHNSASGDACPTAS